MQRLCLLLAAVVMLAACSLYKQTSRVTAYQVDGKLFHVEDFAEENRYDEIDRTVTMWQIVDGKRQYIGAYTADDTPLDKDEIPAEAGHKRAILTVVQQGDNLGVVSETTKEVPGGH